MDRMIKNFYDPFHKTVEDTLEHSERASGERYLGEHPKTGEKVIVRIGRYGPMAQIGDTEGEKKAQFASLRPNQSIETITFEEVMDLFKLPRELGDRKSTRLNSSHVRISYAVFCLIKKIPSDRALAAVV